MGYLTGFGIVIGTAVALGGVYFMARSEGGRTAAYLSLGVDVLAMAAGMYLLSTAVHIDMKETSGAWFLMQYVFAMALVVLGARFGYESWKLRP